MIEKFTLVDFVVAKIVFCRVYAKKKYLFVIKNHYFV